MELDAKRAGLFKKINITHYAIVILMVLVFLQWLMPYFKYEPTSAKQTKEQNSMWGEILFNYNFMQLEDVMKDALNTNEKVFKYVNLQYLGAPVLMMVFGIILLCTMGKKGIAWNILPLVVSICGLKGWLFGNLIPRFCNVPFSKISIVILAGLMLLLTIANIVFCAQEIKSRPADYYLPSMG